MRNCLRRCAARATTRFNARRCAMRPRRTSDRWTFAARRERRRSVYERERIIKSGRWPRARGETTHTYTQCVYRVVDRPRVRVEKRTHTRYTHHGLWGVPASVLRFKFIILLPAGRSSSSIFRRPADPPFILALSIADANLSASSEMTRHTKLWRRKKGCDEREKKEKKRSSARWKRNATTPLYYIMCIYIKTLFLFLRTLERERERRWRYRYGGGWWCCGVYDTHTYSTSAKTLENARSTRLLARSEKMRQGEKEEREKNRSLPNRASVEQRRRPPLSPAAASSFYSGL